MFELKTFNEMKEQIQRDSKYKVGELIQALEKKDVRSFENLFYDIQRPMI